MRGHHQFEHWRSLRLSIKFHTSRGTFVVLVYIHTTGRERRSDGPHDLVQEVDPFEERPLEIP